MYMNCDNFINKELRYKLKKKTKTQNNKYKNNSIKSNIDKFQHDLLKKKNVLLYRYTKIHAKSHPNIILNNIIVNVQYDEFSRIKTRLRQ